MTDYEVEIEKIRETPTGCKITVKLEVDGKTFRETFGFSNWQMETREGETEPRYKQHIRLWAERMLTKKKRPPLPAPGKIDL